MAKRSDKLKDLQTERPTAKRGTPLEGQDNISKRLAGLDQLERWIDANVARGLPLLSDEEMDRAIIYEGRGL